MKQRFRQWVGSVEYIVGIQDGAELGAKVMARRRLRNNFNKYHRKCKELKRFDHIMKRVQWFNETRNYTTTNDCYQSWRLYIKRYKLAKKFILRSSNSLDKQLVNEGFSIWKQMCSRKKQKLYIDHIQELDKRKAEHEEQIQHFKVQIEKNESRQAHLVSKMQSQAHRIMGNFIVRMNSRQIARGFYKWFDVVSQDNQKRRFLRKAMLYWHRRAVTAGFRTWAE